MDGIAIIDKPAGWTSHDVVARARRILRERRIGHTGTLDPFATGVLVLLVGRATRLAPLFAGAEKEYEALVRFGYRTDTGDATGTLLRAEGDAEDVGAWWGEEEIERAMKTLRGEIEQTPPMYSAKKIQGKKLYELARRGETVERAPVRITIHEFEAMRGAEGAIIQRNADGTCDMRARVVCSAGTYVRVLAEDLGTALGAGAHLAELRRTRAGAWRIESATTMEAWNALAETDAARQIIISPDAALSDLPSAHLTDEEARRARNGAATGASKVSRELRDGERVRMRDLKETLIAVGVYTAATNRIQPRIILVPTP